jgi:protease-4
MTEKSQARQHSFIRRGFSLFDAALRVVTRLFVAVCLLGIVVVVLFLLTGGPVPKVPKNAVLIWSPQGQLADEADSERSTVPGKYFFRGEFNKTRVADLVTVLKRAAKDPRIRMVLLKPEGMGRAGMAQLQELTAAIRGLETTGKSVIATSVRYNQLQYLLAAQARKVYLDPIGDVELKGFGIYPHYFKDALDKFGIGVDVFRVGKYKAAVEPFMRRDMSPDAREEHAVWLNGLWAVYKDEVAAGRRFEPEKLDRYVGEYADLLAAQNGDAARTALEAGLVDQLVTDEDLQRELDKTVGVDPDAGSYARIDDRDYLRATRAEQAISVEKKIGLIAISGPIVEGESWPGVAGAETITDLIRRGYKNKKIAALVLRVNSPGGSLYASEKVRRQVAAAREAGKPVVVSMSSMAASGGYWIAVNANQIWAEDSTITGSIGIFSLQLSVQQFLERLGITSDSVETTPLAGAMRLDRPLTPDARRILQSQVDQGYDRFVKLVAEGRGLSVEAVNQVAQGRVWTGRDGLRLGLVDRVGGLDAAVEAAARLAGIAEGQYILEPISRPRKFFEQLADRAGKIGVRIGLDETLPAWFRERIGYHFSLAWMNDPRGIYVYCPWEPDLGAQ